LYSKKIAKQALIHLKLNEFIRPKLEDIDERKVKRHTIKDTKEANTVP